MLLSLQNSQLLFLFVCLFLSFFLVIFVITVILCVLHFCIVVFNKLKTTLFVILAGEQTGE